MSLLNTISGAPRAWTAATPLAKPFAKVDSNGDGNVDKTELQAAFDAIAAKTGHEARDAEKVIARVDKNGDGEVSRLEVGARMRELKMAGTSTVDLAAKSR
jgi:EF-hand domain pair